LRRKRLLDFAFAAGCAGKACQADLFAILKKLPRIFSPDLIVGSDTADDAGVYRLNRNTALVLTVDVLGPVADEPFTFGQIAAANSLSDVYAMGGKPVACLSVLGFPVNEIEHKTIRAILAGAIERMRTAGAVIAGGHTFKDMEIKFGLAVIGVVHPKKVITNAGACPGDVLILTKPLGTGIITTALKAKKAPDFAVRNANRTMIELNRRSAEVMCRVGVNAVTDVTGFGLLGHSWEMAKASGVNMVIQSATVPFLPGAIELAGKKLYPLGTVNNYRFVKPYTHFARYLDTTTRLVLCDAQTSGGLLIAVPGKRGAQLLDQLHGSGVKTAAVIGWVEKGNGRLLVA